VVADSLTQSFVKGARAMKNSPQVLLIMVGQTLFEGSTYTFVFMWVPVMISVAGPPPALPVGLVFTCFMLCGTIGAALGHVAYEVVAERSAGARTAEWIAAGCCLAFAISMGCCSLYPEDFHVVFGSFLLLEAAVGASYAAYFTLRARLIPEELRATVTNLFRVPLNICVVVGTMLTDRYSPTVVFPILTVWLVLATVAQVGDLLLLLLTATVTTDQNTALQPRAWQDIACNVRRCSDGRVLVCVGGWVCWWAGGSACDSFFWQRQ
jgi:hypothetical protein